MFPQENRQFLASPLNLAELDRLFDTDTTNGHGLTQEQALNKMQRDGKNIVFVRKELSFLKVFLNEVREPMILLLLAVGITYAVLSELVDSVIVFSIILAMVLVEVWNEYRAKKAVEALNQKVSKVCVVIRDGITTSIDHTEVVVGDLIVLRPGDIVPADARLINSHNLQVDESALTGEVVPVQKNAQAQIISVDYAPDCINAVFASTKILKGCGTAVVYATGARSEIGSIYSLAENEGENKKKTKLQNAMKSIAKYLTYAAVGVSILIPTFGWLRGRPFEKMFLSGISLAFCLIPEELPILIKSVLAIGALKLSRRNILIKDLHAAENLGTVTYILTDKTGTLTQRNLRLVKAVVPNDEPVPIESNQEINETTSDKEILYRNWVLSSDMIAKEIIDYLDGIKNELSALANPFDQAIADLAKQDTNLCEILRRSAAFLSLSSITEEIPFDSTQKFSSIIRNFPGTKQLEIIKGATEIILGKCSLYMSSDQKEYPMDVQRKGNLSMILNQYAQNGLRTVGVAIRELEKPFIFVGFLAFEEVIRHNAKEALFSCKNAGIQVAIVTGDHELTTRRVANQVSLANLEEEINVVNSQEFENISDEQFKRFIVHPTIFSRATPLSKYQICKKLQDLEHRVIVTGDGVNDCAAISLADVGIAMGSGADVSKDAAQVILLDDQFSTLETAIEESRKLYVNLCKSIQFYLACKLALASMFAAAVVFNYEFPLTPIQSIIIELWMDLGASTTFTVEKPESDIMKQPPRNPKEKFLNKEFLKELLKGSLCLTFCVFGVYFIGLQLTKQVAVGQSMAFASWTIGHLILAMNSRTKSQPIIFHGLFSNKLYFIWAFGAITTLLLVNYVSFLKKVMGIITLSIMQWSIVIAFSIISSIWIEIWKCIRYYKNLTWNINAYSYERLEIEEQE
jgi:Ca2+-transporting ATPase